MALQDLPRFSSTEQTVSPGRARHSSPEHSSWPNRASESLSLRSAPALFAALGLSAGILLSSYLRITPGPLFFATLLITLITALAARAAVRIVLLPLGCCWLVLGMFLNQVQPQPDPQRALRTFAENGGARTVEGEVIRAAPVRLESSTLPFSTQVRKEQTQSVDIRVHSVAGSSIAGGLRATLYGPADKPFPTLHCGDTIRAMATMHVPERYLDPGVWDSSAWLLSQGVGVVGALKTSELGLAPRTGYPEFICWVHSVQQIGSQRLLDFASTATAPSWLPAELRLTNEDAGMVSAMVLGDRSYLDRQQRIGFERTGSFHLLVVSGMHLAIFAGFIFTLGALLRLPNLWATILTVGCSLAYAVLTGFGDPVRRSFWMVTLFLFARLLFRERNSLNAVGFAALCMLAWDPHALLEASFQMTLLSVVIIAGVVVPIAEHTFSPYLRAAGNLGLIPLDTSFPPHIAQFRVTLRLIADHLQPFLGRRLAQVAFPGTLRFLLGVLELLLASSIIELAMALPMATYFHRVTAAALPVNILVVPLIGIALPAALITFVAVLVSPSLAIWPAAITAGVLHAIDALVHFFGYISFGDLRIPAPGGPQTMAAISLIGLAIWAARNSRLPVTLSLTALVCSAVCVLYPRPLVYLPGALEITAIDVGQGDSLLLVSPQGKTLLIDAGGPIGGSQPAANSNFEIGEDVVSPVLWARNIRHLDAVELTHAHSDHMGGMPDVLRNFRPKELWVGNNPHIPAYDALLGEAQELNTQVRSFFAGDSFDFGGAHIQVLSPARGYVPGATASNDDSLVIHVSYGHTSVLLEGDAETRSENRMLGENLASDLLKVGHHGSKTSSIPPFLAEVHPRLAIISVGHRNPYGHPRIEVLDRLQENKIRTYRTDAIGATSFYLDGKTVAVRTLAGN